MKAHYAGFAGDGHLGPAQPVARLLLGASASDSIQPIEGRPVDISAQLAAARAVASTSDWVRLRLTGFFASGDDDPRDGKGDGFDAIYDNPNFAGGPFSFWSAVRASRSRRRACCSRRRGACCPSLRANKFEGQASYVNPGLVLLGAGLDLALTPKLRASLNANYLRFHKTGALSFLLFQPGIRKDDRPGPRRRASSTGRC